MSARKAAAKASWKARSDIKGVYVLDQTAAAQDRMKLSPESHARITAAIDEVRAELAARMPVKA